MSQPARSTPTSPETRLGIVEAALEAFTELGFDGASTREIASRAGVNHGLIPYYFGTKQKLWRAAVDLAFDGMREALDALMADDTIATERERAARMIRAHIDQIAARPAFVRLMHEEGKRRGPRMRWIVDRHVRPLYGTIVELLGRIRSGGSFPIDADPVHFFYVMAGATGLIFHQAEECRRLTGVDPLDPAVVAEHKRVVEALLLGPAEETPR